MVHELRHMDEPLPKFSAVAESTDPQNLYLRVSDRQNFSGVKFAACLHDFQQGAGKKDLLAKAAKPLYDKQRVLI